MNSWTKESWGDSMDDNSSEIISATAILEGRLYFATLKSGFKPPLKTKTSRFFTIKENIYYESFYNDFGPYHLGHLYYFCQQVNSIMEATARDVMLVFHTSEDKFLRLNAAYLIAGYLIVCHDYAPRVAYRMVTCGSSWELLTFRDASGGPALFKVALDDVLGGLAKAHKLNMFNFRSFDCKEYEFYEKVLNGDLNWIIPEKILAFSGPHAQSEIKDGYPLHSPYHYHKYFKSKNVTTIVRLNKKSYKAKMFTDLGFDHFELFFIDGSSPSEAIVARFIKICEEAKGAVAVHCKAGLGRTGTLIACYMMKHYNFTAHEAIAWLRICRPGSVIGHQQNFLEKIESKMLLEGELMREREGVVQVKPFKHGVYPLAGTPNLKTKETDGSRMTTTPNRTAAVTSLEPEKKQHKEDFVKLDSIINSHKPAQVSVATHQLQRRKPRFTKSYDENQSSKLTNQPKVIASGSLGTEGYKTFKPAVSSRSPGAGRTIGGSPSAKAQHPKQAIHRANLASSFNTNGRTGLKFYAKKSTTKSTQTAWDTNAFPAEMKSNSASSITTLTQSCSLNGGNRTLKDGNAISKKCTKCTWKCNTSDSETDGNAALTILDYVSGPAKMTTRRAKSKSPEPMDQCLNPEKIKIASDDGVDSQGSRLFKIKASRKKLTPTVVKKEGVQTRSHSTTPSPKKK